MYFAYPARAGWALQGATNGLANGAQEELTIFSVRLCMQFNNRYTYYRDAFIMCKICGPRK